MKWAITVLSAVVAGTLFSGAPQGQAQDMSGQFAVDADGSRDCTHLVASGNPDYPPYLWQSEDGTHLLGAAADMIKRVGELAGVEIEVIHAGSWGRVQQSMREGSIDLIAGAFLTVPRMDYMDYFYPAFQGTRTVIWTRDNLDLKYLEWSDLIGLEGLTVIDNSFGQRFDAYAAENLNIREVPTLEQGLQMLALNRAEYLIYEEFPAKAVAAREKVTDIRSYTVPVSAENLYLTMSHKSECNTGKLRGKIAQALFKLVADDVMAEMVDANVARWGSSTN